MFREQLLKQSTPTPSLSVWAQQCNASDHLAGGLCPRYKHPHPVLQKASPSCSPKSTSNVVTRGWWSTKKKIQIFLHPPALGHPGWWKSQLFTLQLRLPGTLQPNISAATSCSAATRCWKTLSSTSIWPNSIETTAKQTQHSSTCSKSTLMTSFSRSIHRPKGDPIADQKLPPHSHRSVSHSCYQQRHGSSHFRKESRCRRYRGQSGRILFDETMGAVRIICGSN